MMIRQPDLAGRRIAILGAGREGRAALAWLRAQEAAVDITVIAEQAPEAGFSDSLQGREQLMVEPLTSARLLEFDLLIRSPGISPHREPLRVARERGAQFTTASSLWFATHPQARTVCITGTKGKSTTAALTAHLLRACGLRVQLAGNIGRPLLDCPDEACDWWVIELSSYQIADLLAAPTIAVILNVSPEHLDWHGSVATYLADKLRLAELACAGTLILNATDPELADRFAGREAVTWFGAHEGIHATAAGMFDGAHRLPVAIPASLPGAHNRMNLAAALSVVRAAGADLDAAAAAVGEFTGLPHRLQVLGRRDGITFIDDSIASNPVATAAALEALADRPVLLIVGGFDRGIDWGRYLPAFRRFAPRAVFGLPDNGERIVAWLRASGVQCREGLHAVPGLAEAVDRARQAARPGDTVLLSPGAPSFPWFADYRERGRAFARFSGFSATDE